MENKKIRLLIAEDHKIMREGLISNLSAYDEIEVVGEASDGIELIKIATNLMPDIILLDIGMPKLGGLDAAKILRKKVPVSKLIVLTAHKEQEYITEFMKLGVKGYLLKDSSTDELVQAIFAVNKGGKYFGAGLPDDLLDSATEKEIDSVNIKKSELSEREKEILTLVAKGYSSKEISEKLFISFKTVKAHREHIMQKLDIDNVAGLTKYAIKTGLIDL